MLTEVFIFIFGVTLDDFDRSRWIGAGAGVTTVDCFLAVDVDDDEAAALGGGGAAAFRDLAFGLDEVGVPNDESKGFAGVLSTTDSPGTSSSSLKGFPPPSSSNGLVLAILKRGQPNTRTRTYFTSSANQTKLTRSLFPSKFHHSQGSSL